VALGTPKSTRTRCWRDRDFDALKGAPVKYLENRNHSLLGLIGRVRRWRAFLLCFEADPAPRHRSLVAAAAQRLGGPPAKHL
jgi:hypothetical protein